MKRFLTLFTLVLLTASCAQKDPGFCYLTGTVAGPYAADGAYLEIALMEGEPTNIVPDGNGDFSLVLPADKATLARILLMEKDQPRAKYRAEFIPESGEVKIILGRKEKVKGGPVNQSFEQFKKYSREFSEAFRKIDLEDPASEPEIKRLGDTFTSRCDKLFMENPDNWVGLMALTGEMYNLSLEELDTRLEKAAEFIRNHPIILDLRKSLVAQAQTAEGKLFIDFQGTTPDGKTVTLSEFVGRGNYTLVDFWASWCVPCRQEIPNIKELYETYHPRGLNVLSVAVWDGDNSQSRKAIDKMGMVWDHIFVGTDRTPTEIYGIASIPHVILFAPDGTVYRRGLRGEELKDAVSELFN